MPTAKLLKPASLNTDGKIWKKGVTEPVSNQLARKLAKDTRFLVKDLDEKNDADEEQEPEPRPKGKALSRAILATIDDLDPDDEDLYGPNGMATAAAISKALGYEVTEAEVEVATGKMGAEAVHDATQASDSRAMKSAAAKPSKAEAAVEAKTGLKITRVPKKPHTGVSIIPLSPDPDNSTSFDTPTAPDRDLPDDRHIPTDSTTYDVVEV